MTTTLIRPVAVNVNTGALTYEGSIDTAEITDGGVATADLADGAVTTAKILDGTITTTDVSTTSFDARYGKLAGSTWTGTQDFTGATVTGVAVAAVPQLTVTAGNYMPTATQNTAGGTPTLSQLRAYPIIVWKTQTFDRIGIEVTSFSATAVVRLGIYNDNGAGMPGTLVLDAGTVDAGASNSLKTITISQSLTPGVYWLAAVSQTVAPGVRILTGGGPYRHVITTNDPTNYSFSIAETATVSSVTGALPTPFGATGTAGTSTAPYVVLRGA